MQLSDILQNEKFKGASPDQQEEILDLYEQAVKESSFGPNRFDMRSYVQAKRDVEAAKQALQLMPDPRSFGQRLMDEFKGGMENAAMAGTAVLAATGGVDPETAAARIAEDDRDMQARPVSRAMRNFQHSSNQGWAGPILNLFTNPEAAALITAQGLGTSIPGLAAGGVGALAARKAGAGKEMALAATMLGVGGASSVIEGGSRFIEDLRQEVGGDLQDTEAVANILRDPQKVEQLKQRAVQRGATVGAFDAASVALPANALFKTARGLKGLAQQGIGNAAIQGMLGGAGEIAGNVVIGEETDPADAWAEFIGEMVPGMIELGIGGAGRLIPQTEQAVREKVGTSRFFPSQTSAPEMEAKTKGPQLGDRSIAAGTIAQAAAKIDDPTLLNEAADTQASLGEAPANVVNPPQTKTRPQIKPVREQMTAKEAEKENQSAPANFEFLNNRFGPVSISMDALAERIGMRRGGVKVSTSDEESEALSEFLTVEDQDKAMRQNIDDADFAIVVGNDKSYAKDPGQSIYRNYAYDKESRDPKFKVIDGRSEGRIIPALEEYLRNNPAAKRFTIILPQNTARVTPRQRTTLEKDALNIGQSVFQYLLDRNPDPSQNLAKVDRIRASTGMDIARAADPEQVVLNAIPALRYVSRAESSQELTTAFDSVNNPQALNRVLVFATDPSGNHTKDLGPVAQKMGAEKSKLGLVGNTYALPLFGKRKRTKKTVDRQGEVASLDVGRAAAELTKFYEVAAQNPGKEFWLMVGAYRNQFSKSEERAMFEGAGRSIPENVRLLSSTVANVFPNAARPYKYAPVITAGGTSKKSTRTPEINNLERPINVEQALDPEDRDVGLSRADRIRNKGQGLLSHIILSERQARSLLIAKNSLRFERRRKVVGTPQSGTEYQPKVPSSKTRVSGLPLLAFGRFKGGTMLLRVNNIQRIASEAGPDSVDVPTAAQLAKINPQIIEANNTLGTQYIVDLDFYADITGEEQSRPRIFYRESKAVTEAKASGKQIEQISADDMLPEDKQRAIGAQNNVPFPVGLVGVSMPPLGGPTAEATFVSQMVKPGDTVTAGQEVARVQIGEGIVSVKADYGGVWKEWKAKVGNKYPEGYALGYIEGAQTENAGQQNDPGYLDLLYRGRDTITEGKKRELQKLKAYKPGSKVVVPNENLAQYIREILFEDNPARFREEDDYSSLLTKARRPFRPLSRDERTVLEDALREIGSYKPGAKLTNNGENLIRTALNLAKEYAELQNIARDAMDNVVNDNTWALNQTGNYMNMLGRTLALDPRLGSLARLSLFVPNLGTVSIEPDKIPQYKNGEFAGEATPVRAVFTPGNPKTFEDETDQTTELNENSLYLYDQNGKVLRVLPFSARNRFIPNASGTNIVPFDQVQYPTVSIRAFDTRDTQTRNQAEQEAANEDQLKLVLDWASASGLLPKDVKTDWRGKFALDVFARIAQNQPVIARDPDTVKFIRAYPGVFTGVVENGNSLLVTEITSNFHKHRAEIPINGTSEEFSSLFYRLLVPFFSMQEDLFNREIQLGTKEEKFFLQPVKTVQQPEDVVGGGVGLVGDIVPITASGGNEIPTVAAQIREGERRFEEGLADDTIATTQEQRTVGEAAREDLRQGQQDIQRGYSEPTESARELRSLRQNMLVSPAMADVIRKADPKGLYVRMVVLPEVFYLSSKSEDAGNVMKVAPAGTAIVTGITDPRTGEYMGDKRPIPTRRDEDIESEQMALEEVRLAAAAQQTMGEYVFIPEGITMQDLVVTHQNILKRLEKGSGPILVVDGTIEFDQIIGALQNVVSYDLADDGLYLTGVYDYENSRWIGQLPYGDRRYSTQEIAVMSRSDAVTLGQNINNWLVDRRRAGVDTLVLEDDNLSDEEVKSRVMLLQVTAQSYLEGFGGLRNKLEEDVAKAMMAKTKESKSSLFLETIDQRFQKAVAEGDITPEELPLIQRMTEDAVNVFNSGVVYRKGEGFVAGVTRARLSGDPRASKYSVSEAGRPREHFISRAKQNGIPEQEANNLVDRLSFTTTGEFKNSEFIRRVFLEAVLKSRQAGGERLRSVFAKIETEYSEMSDAFGEDYPADSRPTNTLYGLVLSLSKTGFEGVRGLAFRAREIFQDMKLNERSFVSFEAGAEAIEGEAVAESKVKLLFNAGNMISDYDAQKGLLADEFESDITDYEILSDKANRKKDKYEAFIRQMAEFRETLPFIERAVHDIIMRQGFNFPAGYKPAYLGKSNAQLDILLPTVKEAKDSQIGDEGKGKGFLSGKLLSLTFRYLPGVPANKTTPEVLRQIALQRYEAIRQEMVRAGVGELADLEQVKTTLRQFELEKQAELEVKTEIRKGLAKTGRLVKPGTDPVSRLANMTASTERKGPLPEVIRNLIANSPTTLITEINQLLLNRMRQLRKRAGKEPAFTLQQTLAEELLDPVGTFDDTIEKDSLISPEDDRARLTRILFEAVLPQFEARGETMLENTLGVMRKINAPYKSEANRRRVRRREKDISDIRKLATEENFADAGVSFDSALFNLTDEREIKAMEYLRAAARRTGLKNVRFAANRRENYPVFTLPGTADPQDIINSTIFVNPELLANKLFPEDLKIVDEESRNKFDDLTDDLADQLIKHEVVHLAYFDQIKIDYRNRYPNGEISFDTYYVDRVRKVANFLKEPDNGLMIKLPGKKAMPVYEALTELYPEVTTRDDVLVAEFFRVMLELDKSNGKLFTEGIEYRRGEQIGDRSDRRRSSALLEWIETILNALMSLLRNLSTAPSPTARKIHEVYGKVSRIYDTYFSEFVTPPKPIRGQEIQAEGMVSVGAAFERQNPIGAQATEAISRRVMQAMGLEKDTQLYRERTQAEVLAILDKTGAIETFDRYINEIDPGDIARILIEEGNIDPNKITETELMGATLRLNLTERAALAAYAISRFVETSQVQKAHKLTSMVSSAGRGMGQTISIGFRLLKDFLLRTPSGVVMEYASRLAEGKRELKSKIDPQLSQLSEEVRATQAEMVGVALNSREVQALINQINLLYSRSLGKANPQDLAKLIRQHYTDFSADKLGNVLAAVLPKFENKTLLFDLADMVQKNMLTQLGKQLSLRGRTVRRNIVNRKGMSQPELRAERIQQLLLEMHEVVKPPIPRSGNTVEDAIAGDARKILELASYGALNDDQVLASIESLGKFPAFDVNISERLYSLMQEAASTPSGFQRDRKFIGALKVLNEATRIDGVPLITAYWYMSLLSGPATFWMNFFSTMCKALFDIGTYSIAAANARGNPALAMKYAALGYKTFLASLSTIAWAEAKGILLQGDMNPRTSGKYVDEETINALESMETDTLLKSIMSKGKYIFRIMSASDALFGRSAMEGFAVIQANIQAAENVENGLTNLSLEEEAARLLNQTDDFVTRATQKALSEGLAPGSADFVKRVYELRDRAIQNDPERQAILRRAEDLSLYSTYNNTPYGLLGNISEGIGTLSRKHRILVPLFVPFTKIVSNVTNESLNYVPVIGFYRFYQAKKQAGTTQVKGLASTPEQMEQIKNVEAANLYAVQAVVGLSAMIFASLASFLLKDDDDDGQDDGFEISGSGPKDPAAMRQAREAGFVPYSFSLGGNKLKISYLSTPLAMPLAILGTWSDANKYPRGRDKSDFEKLTSVALTIGQVPFNQSFLQGLSGLFKMLDGSYEGQDRAALEKFVNSTLGSVVPNFARQVEDVFNPIRPTQTSWWGKWVFNKIPVVRGVTGKPTLNVLGEEVNAPMGIERYAFLQRFINTSEADPLFKLLAYKNAFIPDAKRGIMIGNYQLDDEQFYRFRELRGKILAKALRSPSFFAAAKKMTAEQLDDYLGEVGGRATALAKRQLLPELVRAGVKLY